MGIRCHSLCSNQLSNLQENELSEDVIFRPLAQDLTHARGFLEKAELRTAPAWGTRCCHQPGVGTFLGVLCSGTRRALAPCTRRRVAPMLTSLGSKARPTAMVRLGLLVWFFFGGASLGSCVGGEEPSTDVKSLPPLAARGP